MAVLPFGYGAVVTEDFAGERVIGYAQFKGVARGSRLCMAVYAAQHMTFAPAFEASGVTLYGGCAIMQCNTETGRGWITPPCLRKVPPQSPAPRLLTATTIRLRMQISGPSHLAASASFTAILAPARFTPCGKRWSPPSAPAIRRVSQPFWASCR